MSESSKPQNVVPFTKPCSICNGKGLIRELPKTGSRRRLVTERTCHWCAGSGTVKDDR